MPVYLKIKTNELKLPSLEACVPFPVSLSGNSWVLLQRQESPKVVANSGERRTQARFAVGIVEF